MKRAAVVLKQSSLWSLVFLFIFSIAITCSRAQTSNWPQWRGLDGRGVSGETGIPFEWDGKKNVKWKTQIAGRGHSSPIVWGNRIFLTTSVEGLVVPGAEAVRHVHKGQEYRHPDSVGADREYTMKLLAIDADTGKVVWNKTVYQGKVYDNRHKKNTYASATPATDGKYVYLSFEAEGVYCYDFDGKQVWKSSLGKIAKGGMGPGTSPVLYENLLILQCDQEYGEGSFIAAVDKSTGKQVWRVARNHRRSWATPLLVKTGGRTELVAAGAESVIAYDPATGKELWRAPGVESNSIPSPVTGHDMVFVSAGSEAKRALAIRLGGSGNLTDTAHIVWRYDKGTAYVPSPILYGDYLYLMTDAGAITCLEAKTGKAVYQARLPVPAQFTASPVAFDGKLLIISEDGDGFVLRAGPKPDVLSVNSMGEPVYASPAISGGRIFLRGATHLYCISSKS
ncbi:MAG TPA: PQQ-binding-like beta-propeller repeat protein [Blastocatellia bacterium]|nr:PQQ-binding-like beta-propeller repeat protein [Blastocatellia bacterium]